MTRDEAERRRWDFFNSLLAGITVTRTRPSGDAIRGKKMLHLSRIRKKAMILGLLFWLFAFVPFGIADDSGVSEGEPDTSARSLKRARHMEFDERLIMGQSLKSGALYLFERKDSEIQTMLKIRKDYREELLAPLEPPP
jgi:hypothetical protein